MKDSTEGKTYDLALTGEGISVKQKIPEAVAYRIVAVLMGGVSAPTSHSSASAGSAKGAMPSTSIGQSVREYMDSTLARRNPEKILAIARFVAENEGRSVEPDEMKKEFKAAAEPVPGNFSRDLRWAVQVGWLAEDRQDSGRYYVTANGEEALRQQFSDEIRKRTKIGMGARRKRRRRPSSGTAQ